MVTLDGALGGRVGASYSSNPSSGIYQNNITSPTVLAAANLNGLSSDVVGSAVSSNSPGFNSTATSRPSSINSNPYNLQTDSFELLFQFLKEPDGGSGALKRYVESFFQPGDQRLNIDSRLDTVGVKVDPFNTSQLLNSAAGAGAETNNFLKEQLAVFALALQNLQSGGGEGLAGRFNAEAEKRGLSARMTSEQASKLTDQARQSDGNRQIITLMNQVNQRITSVDEGLGALQTRQRRFEKATGALAKGTATGGGATG